MDDAVKSFIGTGWAFPPTFERLGGYSVKMQSGDENIKESLRILLSTVPGERIMLPEFGCDLRPMLFENLDTSLIKRMKGVIGKAIMLYEPRVEMESIDITPDATVAGLVLINVTYMIRQTNSRANMVYPFYTMEGTDIA